MGIIPISSAVPNRFPLYVAMPSVSEPSMAVLDQIRVVDKERVGKWKATATDAEMAKIVEAMKIVFEVE